MIEFDCIDCGRHVAIFGSTIIGPDPVRCSVCFWIRECIPEPEWAAVRERLGVPLQPTEIREPLDWPE